MNMGHVPKIGLRYWVSISLASVFGANLGDFSSRVVGLGHVYGLLPLAAAFACILFMEHRSRLRTEAYYWLAIVVLRTGATNIADFADHDLKLSPVAVLVTLTLILGALLLYGRNARPAEARSTAAEADRADAAPPEGDVAAQPLASGFAVSGLPTTNALYWASMLTAGVLGTALGDYAAEDLGLGLGRAASLFIPLVVVAVMLQMRVTGTTKPIYWATIVLIRTAGTNVGDFLASKHGLGLGLPVSTPLTGLLLLLTLVLWRPETWPVVQRITRSAAMDAQPLAARSRSWALAFTALGLLGWVCFAGSFGYVLLREREQASRIASLEVRDARLSDDVKAQQVAAQAATAEARHAALEAIKTLQEAQSRLLQDRAASVEAIASDAAKAMGDAEAKVFQERDNAIKATIEAKANQERLMAETIAIQQEIGALKQEALPLRKTIAALEDRQAYLSGEVTNVEAMVANLRDARIQASKSLEEANGARLRALADADALGQSNASLQRQVAQMKADLAAGGATLAGLQEQIEKSHATLDRQAAIYKQLTTMRDQLTSFTEQAKAGDKAAPDVDHPPTNDAGRLTTADEAPLPARTEVPPPASAQADAPAARVTENTAPPAAPTPCINWATRLPCRYAP